MNFQECVKHTANTGLAVAVFFHNREIPEEISRQWALDTWISVYSCRFAGSEHKELAFLRISERAKTFKDWLQTWSNAPWSSKLQMFALEKLSEFTEDVDTWASVCQRAPSGSSIESLALQKLSEFTESPAVWQRLLDKGSVKDNIKALALQKLSEFAVTFDELLHVFHHYAPSKSDLKAHTLGKLSELAVTFEDWVVVQQCAQQSDREGLAVGANIEELAFKRLLELVHAA